MPAAGDQPLVGSRTLADGRPVELPLVLLLDTGDKPVVVLSGEFTPVAAARTAETLFRLALQLGLTLLPRTEQPQSDNQDEKLTDE